MFRKIALKRDASEISNDNDEDSPSAKVYLVKILTDENNELDVGSVSNVVEVQSNSAENNVSAETVQVQSDDGTQYIISEEFNDSILNGETHVIIYDGDDASLYGEGTHHVIICEDGDQPMSDVEPSTVASGDTADSAADNQPEGVPQGDLTESAVNQEREIVQLDERSNECNSGSFKILPLEDVLSEKADDAVERDAANDEDSHPEYGDERDVIYQGDFQSTYLYESCVIKSESDDQSESDNRNSIIGGNIQSETSCRSAANPDIRYLAVNKEKSSQQCKTKKSHSSGWIVNRHKLRFQENWLKEFPFIEYDENNNRMFCKACRKYVNDFRKTSPFVIGTDNFRVSMIRYHLRSSMHAECQELYDTLISQDSGATEKDLYKDQLSHVFKSVYFIFKNKMPYSHYPILCESQKREGADFTVYSTHIKVVPLFGKFIGMAFEKEVGRKICNIAEFSIIIDASFRRNIESHDLVYIKYLDNISVQTVFLGVIDSSAKLHDSMYNILSNLFKRYNIDRWVDKVVYIMTDKSDTHLWLEGLMNLIKTMSPRNFFAEARYLPHKVKFCGKVVQKHKITFKFDALLWSIYCYYEKVDSSKKNLVHMNKELEEIIDCYGGLPKNSYTTMYYEALKAIEEDYHSLVPLLESEQPLLNFIRKSGGKILSVITRWSFIYKMALFIDIFACLSDFSTKLGSEDLLPYDVLILLDEVCTDLEKAANGEGTAVTEIEAELSETPSYFRGIEIIEDSSLQHVLPEIKEFCDDIISYLKSLVDSSLLEKSYIFNVCLWPEEDEVAEFGNLEFQEIFLKFNGKEKHLPSAVAEWNLFKSKVLSVFPAEVRENSKSVILKMAVEHDHEFPFVASVLKKILLLNFESGEVKRGYHEMCLNKSFSRSMLSLQSLQTAMMISMHGPSLNEFDFSLALDLFLNSRHRKFRKKIINKKLTEYYSDLEEED